MSVSKSNGTPPIFPYFQVVRYFRAFCAEHPEVKATHRSLFYFLLETVERRNLRPRFQLNREDGMEGSGIGSKNTYLAVLKQLHDWRLVDYTAGKNGNQAAVIEVLPTKSTVPELGRYWDSRWDSKWDADGDAAGTVGGTTSNTYNLLPKDSEREAAPRSLADEKKIQDLERQLALLKAQAAETPPVAAPPLNSEAAPLVPEPLAEGAVLPAFVDPRLADDDPRKWEAIPRDAAMVQDYIDTYHDPVVKARGQGKAHLFFEHYGSVGWKIMGRNGAVPVANWRHLIRQFQFREQLSHGTHGSRSTAPGNGTVASLPSYGGNRRRNPAPGAGSAPTP